MVGVMKGLSLPSPPVLTVNSGFGVMPGRLSLIALNIGIYLNIGNF